MPHRTLVRGSFQPVLEDAFVAEVALGRDEDPLAPRRVLVPSNLLKLHLRRLLARRLGAHLNVRFFTLIDLARELGGGALAARGLAPLPALARELIVAEIARAAPADSYFGPVRDLAGFPSVLAATLQDVRDALLDAAVLRRARLETLGDAEREKVRAFADLLERYERRLADLRRADDADLFRAAIDSAPGHAFFQASPAGRTLLVYGFYDFTAAQRRLLEVVLDACDATVFTPIGDGRAFDYARPALAFFRAGATEEIPPPSATERPAGTRAERGRALDVLRARLFATEGSDPSAPAPLDESVLVVASPGAPREAREVVRVLRERLEAGDAPEDVGVLLRSADAYALIEEQLRVFGRGCGMDEDAKLPLYVHGGRALSEQRVARSATLLLDAIVAGLPRGGVFEWMHYADAGTIGAGGGAGHGPAVLEREARAAGIVGGGDGGPEEWRQRLSRHRLRLEHVSMRLARDAASDRAGDEEEGGAAPDAGAIRARIEAVAFLRALADRLAAFGESLRAARDFVSARDAFLALLADTGTPATDLERVAATLEPFGELDALGLACDREAFCRVVRSALEGETLREGRFQHGAFLGTVLAARGLPFGTLIVPGLLDGVFPRTPTADPILLDDERLALAAELRPRGDVGLPLAARAADEDRMLFLLVCQAARDRLVLAFPRLDAERARENLPSSLLVAAVECLAGTRLDGAELLSRPQVRRLPVFEEASDLPPLDLRAFDRGTIARAVQDAAPERVLFLPVVAPATGPALQAELARWGERTFTRWDGALGTQGPALPDVLSASVLEGYARCPFSHFAQHVLGLEEPLEPERALRLDPLERGSLIHAVLEEFVPTAVATYGWPLTFERREELRRELAAVARRRLDAHARENATGPLLLWEADRAELELDVLSWLDAEIAEGSEYVPTRVEAAFGAEGGAPALRMTVDRTTLTLRGLVDRIDVDPATRGVRVVDYKTGRPYAKWHGTEGGRRLQLPLYALAVERALQVGSRVEVAEYLFCTRKGEGARRAADPALWRETAGSDLERVLRGIVAAHRAGTFLADPRDAAVCRVCSFRLACGRGAGLEQRFERKRGDPAARAYFGLDAASPASAPGGAS